MQILEQTLAKALYKMLALELEHSPKADELNFSVAALTETLVRNGLTDKDAERVEEALVRCSVKKDRWPTPAMIMKNLPAKALSEPEDQCRFAGCVEEENLHRCGGDNPYYLCTEHMPTANYNAVRQRFAHAQNIVDIYVDEYQTKHHGSSKREACMAYAKEMGFVLPSSLSETADVREARLEREAIQAEAG